MEIVRAIGLDIGTTTICAVVIDGKSGQIVETITRPNNSVVASGNGWEKLQDPSTIIDNIEKIVSELEMKYAPIACIGLTGQMHGIVYVDKEGNGVSPLYTWQDGRGNLEYKDGISYADYLSKASGYKLASGFGAVTHFFNQVNGLVPDSAKYFCTIQDYAAIKLARVCTPLLHATNAASLGFFNIEGNNFDHQAIIASGMDAAFFPDVSSEKEIIGTTGSKIPVAITIGDNQASFIGSVRNNEECLLVNIGTGGQISLFVNNFHKSPQIEIRPFPKGGFLLVGSSLCGGKAYSLLENFFGSVIQMATGNKPPVLYDIMNNLANDSSPIENKLEISTLFCGTRENPWQRAAISNIGVDNFTPQHFIVGVLEGEVKELHNLYEIMRPEQSHQPKRLIGSGNGIRLSRPLQKIVSNVFDMPLSIPLYKEEAGYGAALFGLVATGYFKSLPEAQSLIQYE